MAADPLILPSLLTNRGFTSGLLLGLASFAEVNGLAYVIPLFLQTALGMKRSAAAIALSPVMIGIIVSSIVCRPLVATLGRGLVVTGLGISLAGAAGCGRRSGRWHSIQQVTCASYLLNLVRWGHGTRQRQPGHREDGCQADGSR